MVGPTAGLWVAAPDLALTLLSTMPSGTLEVVEAREGVSRRMLGPGWPTPPFTPPVLTPYLCELVYSAGVASYGLEFVYPTGFAVYVFEFRSAYECHLHRLGPEL